MNNLIFILVKYIAYDWTHACFDDIYLITEIYPEMNMNLAGNACLYKCYNLTTKSVSNTDLT